MNTGLFIVFEGIEGCGKSTQARLLAEQLAAKGIPYVLTREPGGTRTGEALRHLVLHATEHVAIETELLLMLAARAAHVHEVVRPALERGDVVVCDRYELSSFAYQGLGRGLGLDRVKALNAFATGGLKPDLTILVDVPFELGTQRRAATREADDRIESAGSGFHQRVSEAYRLLAEQEDRMVVVDGTAAQAEVAQNVKKLLSERFPETLGSISG